jgi:hypothetical protein
MSCGDSISGPRPGEEVGGKEFSVSTYSIYQPQIGKVTLAKAKGDCHDYALKINLWIEVG